MDSNIIGGKTAPYVYKPIYNVVMHTSSQSPCGANVVVQISQSPTYIAWYFCVRTLFGFDTQKYWKYVQIEMLESLSMNQKMMDIRSVKKFTAHTNKQGRWIIVYIKHNNDV